MENNQKVPDSIIIDELLKSENIEKSLIVIGEGFPIHKLQQLKNKSINVLTNRYDFYIHLKNDVLINLSDLEISGEYKKIYLRILKDKTANFYLINQSFSKLPLGGAIVLSGNKNEGIKTYIKAAEKRFGSTAEIKIVGNGNRIAIIRKNCSESKPLNDKSYKEARNEIVPGEPEIYSKPGIFGWQKLDAGSRFLIENITLPKDCTLLDLGCGYGYISIKAWELGASFIHATDNNFAAVELCKKNFSVNGINGEVTLDDCGERIKRRFEVVLCNPPFHVGYDSSKAITKRFMTSIHRRLADSGIGYIVVNKFISVEKVLKSMDVDFSEVINNSQFKIIKIVK